MKVSPSREPRSGRRKVARSFSEAYDAATVEGREVDILRKDLRERMGEQNKMRGPEERDAALPGEVAIAVNWILESVDRLKSPKTVIRYIRAAMDEIQWRDYPLGAQHDLPKIREAIRNALVSRMVFANVALGIMAKEFGES